MNKIEITYIFRPISKRHSIEKVFNTFIQNMNYTSTQRIFLPHLKLNFINLVKNIFFTRLESKNREVIYHITGDVHYATLSLIGKKTINTYHDLVFLRNAKNKLDYYIKFFLFLYLPVKLSDEITCVSKKTFTEIKSKINVKNIRIIYNPVSDDFKPSIKKFNEENPTILHIGTGWNKNLINVIKSLKDIRCHLRIIGKLDINQVEELNKTNINFSNSFNLTDDEILKEYQNCDIVSFPSIYEGFGMPIIEAQSIGRVVVTSNIEPIKEIAKNSAIYVDPNDISSIREGFFIAIRDKNYRDGKIHLGYKNVQRFSSQNITNQYLELYKTLL